MALSQSRQKRNPSRDLAGRLRTQAGPRTTAPMWPRPFFTPGEWAVYTALWSYPNDSVFPTHQDLADRAWVERGTAADAVAKMDREGLLEREASERDDGSQSSNTYYLVEVPSAAQLAKLEDLRTARAAEQEAKRRKRKAANRRYEKQQLSPRAAGGYGEESTPVRKARGTAQAVPRGSGARRTPGGTAQAVPGSGVGRTHESLGVGVTDQVTGRSSSSPSLSARHGADHEQENPAPSLGLENQESAETAEFVRSDAHWPTLTEAEQALADEVSAVAPSWSARTLRKVIGSRTVREVAQRDPELVRRAFLIGARHAAASGADARQGTTVPMRLWYVESCPHWPAAQRELAVERGEVTDAPVPPPAELPSAAQNRARVDSAVLEHEAATTPATSTAPVTSDARELARRNAAKRPQPTEPKRTLPQPRPRDDAAAKAATDEARTRARAALAAAYPDEVPATV